jgi:hypothetical protein
VCPPHAQSIPLFARTTFHGGRQLLGCVALCCAAIYAPLPRCNSSLVRLDPDGRSALWAPSLSSAPSRPPPSLLAVVRLAPRGRSCALIAWLPSGLCPPPPGDSAPHSSASDAAPPDDAAPAVVLQLRRRRSLLALLLLHCRPVPLLPLAVLCRARLRSSLHPSLAARLRPSPPPPPPSLARPCLALLSSASHALPSRPSRLFLSLSSWLLALSRPHASIARPRSCRPLVLPSFLPPPSAAPLALRPLPPPLDLLLVPLVPTLVPPGVQRFYPV